ncbi:inhibitor of apoptosis repeat-containing protein [Byssothecium circinans]|uniref:Inhibitor of apoptosis repeat-containing protein n=1 Tax=Byssothecium circinans TaxID=147558 RepID=A0A6A5TKH4_9PLEO|nr:inhibitor of apoptosis repeat-containing protein [Byssothecium circinans]
MDSSYASYQARLDTFAPPKSKSRRTSSRSKKPAPKATQKGGWPHTYPRPDDLAYAGFVFRPTSASFDNVQCFSCQTQLDGWEESDTPAFEHLTHSPNCGFAINVCIRLRHNDPGRVEDDPLNENMVEARRMTFADLWPLDEAAGFPSIEQMVNAGWYYDPSNDTPDGVTCPYCSLSLDAWDAGDDPTDEHSKRSPDCLFFSLKELYHPTQKTKATRGKRASSRSSTASRTAAKSTRTKKAVAKEELNKALQPQPSLDASIISFAESVTTSVADAPAKRQTKGRKTKKAQEDSIVVESFAESVADSVADAPAKRATRGRKAKKAQEESIIAESFAESVANSVASTASKANAKGRRTKKAAARTSNASIVSTRTTRQRKEPAPLSSPKLHYHQISDLSRSDFIASTPRQAYLAPPVASPNLNQISDLTRSDIIASTPKEDPKKAQKKRTSEALELDDAAPSPKRSRISDLSRSDIIASTPRQTPKGAVSHCPQTPTTPQDAAMDWEPINVDEIFEKAEVFDVVSNIIVDPALDKENIDTTGSPSALVESIKSRLTTAEKQMTIEEWVLYNAKRGEQQLRAECERQIMAFEAQGRRALAALDAH